VLVAGIGWAAYLGSSLGGGGEADSTTAGSTATTTTTTGGGETVTTAATGGTVSGLVAESYDPEGDGTEHPAETANAVDGDVSTRWRTDTYRAKPEFAGIKSGVGLILTAPSRVAAIALHLQAGLDGWSARVYTAPGASPPAGIDGWTPVSEPFSARTVPMDVPLTASPSRLYLIWITKLAPVDTGFAASVAEARLETAGS
jgi:hypothetical protein